MKNKTKKNPQNFAELKKTLILHSETKTLITNGALSLTKIITMISSTFVLGLSLGFGLFVWAVAAAVAVAAAIEAKKGILLD